MTAGAEVVCNDVVRKVEIEEKCVAGVDMNDVNNVGDVATVDGNVGVNSNGIVGGAGKDESDDSSYVFVNGGIEVAAGDPSDTGGGDVDIAPKSDSAVEVDLFKKEELGIENGGISDDPLVMETNGIVHESARVSDDEVKAVKDDLHLENGSTVDPLVAMETNDFAHELNGHLDKITCEEETAVKSVDEVRDVHDITNVEAKTDDIVSAVTFDQESTLNPIVSSQETVFESEESNSQVTITQSLSTPDVINTTDELISTFNPVQNIDREVLVNDEPESTSTVIDKAECEVTCDESVNPSENLESQVTADVSESSGSQIKDQEDQSTVVESVNLSEDLETQVTADVSESSGSEIKEREDQSTVDKSVNPSEDLESEVTGDGPESCVNPIKEQDSEVSVDGSESNGSLVAESAPSGNHTAEVDSNTIVMDSDEKSEEVASLTSEVNVEAEQNHVFSEIKAEQKSDLVSDSYLSENNNSEVNEIRSDTESKQKPDSEIVLSEDTDHLANGQVEKFDEILEIGETQISGTEADETESLVEEPEEKNVEGITESVENVTKFEEIKEHVKIADDIQDSQIVVTENVQNGLNLEDNTTESANKDEVKLETETKVEPIADVSNCIDNDKPQEGFQQEESAENVDPVKSECKNGDLLIEKNNDLTVVDQNGSDETVDSVPDDEEKEAQVKNAAVESGADLVTEIESAEVIDSETLIENVVVPDNEEKETEVKDTSVESVPDLVTENKSADSEIVIENVDVSADKEKETEVKNAPVIEFGSFGHHETIPNIQNDDFISVPDVIIGDKSNDKMWSQEVEEIDGIQIDEIQTSSLDGSVNDAIDVQDDETEVLAYNFLIRIPRFEDESFRDQIRSAQLQVEEKTRIRDAIRVEIHNKRAKLRAHNEAFNAARAEETAARRLVRLKRQEIDSVQVVVNRLKNAMSVEDIDNRIFNMEHMIQHETLILRDEKQFIREIKQLKTLRDQLASNMGTPEEIRQAIDQKEQNEERMKTLRKELDSLKDKVSKAEAVVKAIGIKYDEESKKERQFQAQFRAADDVRQKAYAHLNSLKKLSYEKNKDFRLYKDDVIKARDFASRGDKDSLHRLCANQVEAFMEQWNNNDEFRNDYINRCNLIASRRQKALEGASDDVAPVDSDNINKNVDKSLVSTPSEVASVTVEQENIISSTENEHADNEINNNNNIRSIEIVSGQKNENLKTKGPAKPTKVAEVAVIAESAVDDKNEEENVLTKEEIELARKAEELQKEEIAAKLKEQKRLEEKAKAIEALERKKRNAEKAQIRAEIRAQKEAEQKEKEREKRLRKKEKKKTGGNTDGSINGEEAASSESSNETTLKEPETATKELTKKKTQKPPPHFFSKQLNKPKPIPPPLLNRNKKWWQQWGKFALFAALMLALFVIGNTGLFLNLKVTKSNGGPI